MLTHDCCNRHEVKYIDDHFRFWCSSYNYGKGDYSFRLSAFEDDSHTMYLDYNELCALRDFLNEVIDDYEEETNDEE